ncbi:hypothetical protein BCR36DRAFT_583741 [Piromyces finnis]|uniref:Uncharacterized protein n=1 Tax=Piromyces finnis TaxID=1754191 RepID=A0A1Y1VA93_9FUNG|nr:hypothetical protein BCR36DRAFT_583741 [Piromyces finnis]|eukprot:ORX49674.1 hypothetical protein BCR36DRAFT_583741 [Piromyces finnis]
MDLMAGIVNFSLKKTYLTYCGKGSDGKTCPYSQYVMDNVETNNSYNSTEIGDELKSVLEETCTNSKCYINLESIKKITDTLVEISNNGNSSNSTNKFYNVYSNLKCENIGSDDSSNITSLIRFSFSCIALIIVSTFILF